jgi:hypothetical protein
MEDGDHSPLPERRVDLPSHPVGATLGQWAEEAGFGGMGGDVSWWVVNLVESFREMNCTLPHGGTLPCTSLREAPWSAVRSTALGDDAVARKNPKGPGNLRRRNHRRNSMGSAEPYGEVPAMLRPESSPPKRCFAHALQSAARKLACVLAASSSGLRKESRDAATTEGAFLLLQRAATSTTR